MKQAELISIAEFAKMCRTTVRTIRFYDHLNLIKPVKVDQFTKYRYYSPLQTRDFFRLKLLQYFDIPLQNISSVLRKKSTDEFLLEKTKGVEAQIKQKQKELRFLKDIKSLLFEIENLKDVTKIENVGPFNLFGTYIPREAYHTITPHLLEVQNLAEKLKIPYLDKQVVFYLEKEKYKPKNTKIEIAIVCRGKVPKISLPTGYFFKRFPKTRAYVTTYKGPFDFITLVYEKLHDLQITQKLPVEFAAFDIQLNGLDPKVSNFDRIVKICFPLKK